MGVFKAYDIRGLYPDEVDEDLAYRVGLAYGGQSRTVVVGHDWRRGSYELYRAVIDGLCDAGTFVYALGDVPTPLVSFTIRETKACGGLMITASHNPPEYNGIKLFDELGMSLPPSALKEVEKKVAAAKPGGEDGYVSLVDPWQRYAERLPILSKVKVNIALDAGNGVGAKYVDILSRFFNVVAINTERDPLFSARGPEPTEENVRALVDVVKKRNCAFGLAVDGDGDRAFFVDEEGSLNPSFLFVLFGKYFLDEGLGSTFVATVDISPRVKSYLPRARIVRTRVGTAFVVDAVKRESAIFSGEYSRHYAAYTFSGHSDPVFFTCVLARYVPLKEWKSVFPFPPMCTRSFHVVNKEKAISAARRLAENTLSTIDGVEFLYAGHRVLVRPSNTESKVRIYVEGERAQQILEQISKAVLTSA